MEARNRPELSLVRSEAPARILIAGAVLLIHTVLLLALLSANLGQQPRPQLRERLIWLNLQTETNPRAAKRSRKEVLQQPLAKQRTPSQSAQSPGIPVFSLPIEPNQKSSRDCTTSSSVARRRTLQTSMKRSGRGAGRSAHYLAMIPAP